MVAERMVGSSDDLQEVEFDLRGVLYKGLISKNG